MEPIEKVLTDRLVHFRKLRGLSQQKLADLADMPMRTYQSIEYGQAWPGLENVKAIARALKVSDAELYAAPSESLLSIRDLFQTLASLDDTQIGRYVGMMKAELSTAAKLSSPPTSQGKSNSGKRRSGSG